MDLVGPGADDVTLPLLLRGLCDDAALFPPANVPLAVAAYVAHRDGEYSALVGPFVLFATHLAGVGAARAAIASSLAVRDGARIVAELSGLGGVDVAALRRRFRSFGTCSIADPLADLTALGLIDGPDRSERRSVR